MRAACGTALSLLRRDRARKRSRPVRVTILAWSTWTGEARSGAPYHRVADGRGRRSSALSLPLPDNGNLRINASPPSTKR